MTLPHGFRFHVPLEAFEKADDENPMRIGGIVSTDQLDKQGEKIVQEGLDFRPFLNEGWFNDNHGKNTTDVVGYPTDAYFVRKGDLLPTGKRATSNGWWAEGYLLNTAKGRELWGMAQALHKSPRRLAFSIEGRATERDRRDPLRVTAGLVKNVAVTHCPVNTGTELHALVKALMAGSAIGSGELNQGPGDGGALRRESLEGAPGHGKGSVSRIADGPADDANNGGWAGVDMHKDESEEDEEIAKAVDADFQVVDEFDHMRSFQPHVSQAIAAMDFSEPLTKSEARVIVTRRFPHLSAAQVDAFVDTLTK